MSCVCAAVTSYPVIPEYCSLAYDLFFRGSSLPLESFGCLRRLVSARIFGIWMVGGM